MCNDEPRTLCHPRAGRPPLTCRNGFLASEPQTPMPTLNRRPARSQRGRITLGAAGMWVEDAGRDGRDVDGEAQPVGTASCPSRPKPSSRCEIAALRRLLLRSPRSQAKGEVKRSDTGEPQGIDPAPDLFCDPITLLTDSPSASSRKMVVGSLGAVTHQGSLSSVDSSRARSRDGSPDTHAFAALERHRKARKQRKAGRRGPGEP
jgi:hypothetical protein